MWSRLGVNIAVCDDDRVGLDIYVGSLTRHLVGDWELVAQKAAREMSMELTVVREHDPEDAVRDPERVRPVVLGWREGLSQALGESLTEPLDWNENEEAPSSQTSLLGTATPTSCFGLPTTNNRSYPGTATMWRNGPRIQHTKLAR